MAMTSKERQAKIRMDAKGKIPESKLVSRWTNVGDTNMGNSSLEDIKSVLEEPNEGSLARAIMRSGTIEAACFPPALPCPEMIIECVKKYEVDTRQIIAKDGTILAYLQTEAVEETFNIPTKERMISISIQQGQQEYDVDSKTKLQEIRREWMANPAMKFNMNNPPQFHKSDFHPEIGYLIMFLNRMTGMPQSATFQPWMYSFIKSVLKGKMIDWAGLISQSIHEQFINFAKTKTCHMSSYVVYLLARNEVYSGLTKKGEVGIGPNKYLSHQCYPQLHLKSINHYTRFNDAFAMFVIKKLRGEFHKRLSNAAREFISAYGHWYTQHERYTYLRIQGFTSYPYRLPRYPTNRMVMLEVTRQLLELIRLQKLKKKGGIQFPLRLGQNLECPSLSAAEYSEIELQAYHLQTHGTKRLNFDPFQVCWKYNREFKHVKQLEDHWASAQDEDDLRTLQSSRLTWDLVRASKVFKIPDQFTEDDTLLIDKFDKIKD